LQLQIELAKIHNKLLQILKDTKMIVSQIEANPKNWKSSQITIDWSSFVCYRNILQKCNQGNFLGDGFEWSKKCHVRNHMAFLSHNKTPGWGSRKASAER